MTPTFRLRFHMTTPYRRLQAGIAVSLAALNLVLGLQVWQADQTLAVALDQRETLIRDVRQAHREGLESKVQDTARPPMLARQSVPWELLLDTLARLTPRNLQVLDITPDPEAGTLEWTVQGPGIEALTPYMRALSESGVLQNVYLAEQERAEVEDTSGLGGHASGGWTFVLRGEWLTAASDTARADQTAGEPK